jgi:peptidyl-prolyl cis-trans isomerase C
MNNHNDNHDQHRHSQPGSRLFVQRTQQLLTLILVALFTLLSGCGEQREEEVVEEVVVVEPDTADFDAYLKFRRLTITDETRYERMLAEYRARHALADAVAATGRLDGDVIGAEVAEFRAQTLINRYFEDYLAEAVTEEGTRNYYRTNIADFTSRKAHVAHILLRVKPEMGEVERQALLTTAHELYSTITAGGDFAEVARQYSEDTVSGAKGGDLGWLSEGAVAEAFSEKAFSMRTGEISEPFLTVFGYHIIMVLEEAQEVVRPLEAVEGDIRYQLRKRAKEAEIERLLAAADEPRQE